MDEYKYYQPVEGEVHIVKVDCELWIPVDMDNRAYRKFKKVLTDNNKTPEDLVKFSEDSLPLNVELIV